MKRTARVSALLASSALMAGACGAQESDVRTEQRDAITTTTTTTVPPSTTTSTTTTTSTSTTTSTTTTTDPTVPSPVDTDDLVADVVAEASLDAVECSAATPDATVVGLFPIWTAGEQRNLEITTVVESGSPLAFGVTADATLDVISSDETGASFSWLASSAGLGDAGFPPDLLDELAPVVEAASDTPIDYSLDEAGVFLGIDNPDEVIRTQRAVLDSLVEAAPEVFGPVQEIFDGFDEETLVFFASEQIEVFHAFDGYFLDVGEPIVFNDVLPNAFGGDPFPAVTTIRVIEPVDADGCVLVEIRTEPDAEAFLEVLQDSLAEQLPDETNVFDDEVPDELLESFFFVNSVQGQYDAATQRFVRIVSEQRAGDSSETQVERIVITDVT